MFGNNYLEMTLEWTGYVYSQYSQNIQRRGVFVWKNIIQ